MPVIRPLAADEWRTWRDVRLRALADAPDAFGATLADESRRPDETWQQRLAAAATSGRDCPLVAELDGVAVGLAWAKASEDGALVSLYQVWVAPECRGRGVAAALVEQAIAWSGAQGAQCIELGVTTGETPAVRLYKRLGFADTGAEEALRDGSPLVQRIMRLALRVPGRP